MAWYGDPVLEGDEVSANEKCTCCLITVIIGAIASGMMFRIMTDPGT
jgi:hypothetical protein